MRPLVLTLLALTVFGGSRAWCQETPVLRTALLNFSNISGTAAASVPVMNHLRSRLERKRVALVDADSTMAALRRHRIRSTAELGEDEVKTLAAELGARYLLVGTIDRYDEADSTAEVALSGRLLDAELGTTVWCSYATVFRDPRTRILGIGRHPRAERLVPRVTRRLLKDFTFAPRRSRPIEALRIRGRRDDIRPCRRLALVTCGNESNTRFAGHQFTYQLLAALHRRGFEIVDPGRVRELMLESQELTQGEMTYALLKLCRTELNADFVLTGTISEFISTTGAFSLAPEAALELRLIDTAQNEIVWSRSLSRQGKDSAFLFNLGYVHGLSELSNHMAQELSRALAGLRSNTPPPALTVQ